MAEHQANGTGQGWHQQRLQEALSTGQFSAVAAILDDFELLAEDFGAPNFHLLGHLYNQDLEDARFLWKRLPVSLQQGPDMAALHSLLQVLWQKDYQDIWPVLTRSDWTAEALPMVAALAHKLRQQVVKLLARAYASISLSTAVQLTGYNPAEITPALTQEGWILDESTQCFRLNREAKPAEARTSLADLDRLTGYVVHLETG